MAEFVDSPFKKNKNKKNLSNKMIFSIKDIK